MTPQELVMESLRAPATAARYLLDLGLPRDVLYQALFAAVAVSAFLAGLAQVLFPPPVDMALTPPVMTQPLLMAGMLAAGAVATTFLFHMVGRAMGGAASFDDVLTVLTWMQILRALAQSAIFVISLAVPGVALILSVAVVVVGIYLVTHFMNEAMRFQSLGRTLGMMVAAFTGLIIGLMMLITLFGIA